MAVKKKSSVEITRAALARWQQPGSAGFFAFLDDVKPMIPSERGGYQPYVIPSDRVRAEIIRILDGGYSTAIVCWPRRHGKTVLAALIVVWRFLTRRTQNIAIVANSERQTTDTAFRLVRTVLEQTPYTASLIANETIVIIRDRVTYEAAGNVIQGFPANAASLYGKKLSLAQVSELHATASDTIYQALASSTIDSDDGLVLVDSTVGPRASPLFGLYQLAQNGTDPSLYFSHIEYRDLEDAVANGPSWIKPERLRSRAAQMLPAEFAQQHLNQWTAGTSALFPPTVIEKCKDTYPINVDKLSEGRPFAVGAGLDRAYGFSLHGDSTVAAAVLKVLDGEDEHFYVLACDDIKFSSASGIRRAFTRYHKDFGLKRATIESYNSQDIAAWCGEQPFAHEVVFATAERQSNIFTSMFNSANEGRLHILPRFEQLIAEMETFEYRLEVGQKGTVAKFEHAKGCHDDHVYAVAWAIYSLREFELNPYEIAGIHCDAPGPVARLCLLNDGDLIPPCAEICRSFRSIDSLYQKYKSRAGIAPMNIEDFFAYKVVNIGSHTIKR
ncbi:MAG: terminase family protein [Proteobacteria bacterium]|nr:terminase family protein [Pseudomonadota bacterium]